MVETKETKMETREKILNSAIELFTLRNYNSVGVQEISDHVGIKKGTFYHHYESKKELTLACIDSMWNSYKQEFLDPVFKSNNNILDKFENLVQKFYEYHRKKKAESGLITGCRLGNLALELSTQDDEIRKKIEQKFTKWIEYFENQLEQSVSSKELPKNVNPKKTARAMLSYIEGIALFAKLYNQPSFMHEMKKGISKLVLED